MNNQQPRAPVKVTPVSRPGKVLHIQMYIWTGEGEVRDPPTEPDELFLLIMNRVRELLPAETSLEMGDHLDAVGPHPSCPSEHHD